MVKHHVPLSDIKKKSSLQQRVVAYRACVQTPYSQQVALIFGCQAGLSDEHSMLILLRRNCCASRMMLGTIDKKSNIRDPDYQARAEMVSLRKMDTAAIPCLVC